MLGLGGAWLLFGVAEAAKLVLSERAGKRGILVAITWLMTEEEKERDKRGMGEENDEVSGGRS